MTSNTRDPHLPSPEVCDWLLGLDWSDAVSEIHIRYSGAGASRISECHLYGGSVYADMAIGTNDTGQIILPSEALELLRADQRARVAVPTATAR